MGRVARPGRPFPSLVNWWREEMSAPTVIVSFRSIRSIVSCRVAVSPIRPFRLFSVQSLYRPPTSLLDRDVYSRRQPLQYPASSEVPVPIVVPTLSNHPDRDARVGIES